MLRQVKPGLTENELVGIVDFEIRKAGGNNSFETIVAFGPNASRPHHQPTSRKLRKNDTVLIDFGVRLDGYCCDLTRCFSVGMPRGIYDKVYAVVKQAQAAAIRMVKAGVEISQVDTIAREIIKVCLKSELCSNIFISRLSHTLHQQTMLFFTLHAPGLIPTLFLPLHVLKRLLPPA